MKVRATTKWLEIEKGKYHRRALALSDQLARRTNPKQRGISTTRSNGEYSQRRLKRRRTETFQTSLSWLESEGLTPRKLDLVNNRTGEIETILLSQALEDFNRPHHKIHSSESQGTSGSSWLVTEPG